MATACLIGNGVSVAYNGALTVQQLTQDLMQLFRDAGATEPERALASFAASQAHIEGNQFEALLGPLSSTAEALGYLPGLAELAQAAGAGAVVSALDTASVFLRDLHRIGLAITLGYIAERSEGGSYDEVVWTTAHELINLGNASDLAVATLNYDGLLHAGMMDAGTNEWGHTNFPIVDLAAGYGELSHEVVPGHVLAGHPLRDIDNLLPNRAAIVQLHGSLGWLRDPGDPTAVWRFQLDDLRDADYWHALRVGTTAWQPVVVLTDRKDRAVSNWPFSLSYEIFQRRLITADRWMVAGYGFGDVPVNNVFRTAANERRRLGLVVPRTLVVGQTSNVAALRARTGRTLGIPVAQVIASGVGVPEVYRTAEWDDWKA